MRGKVFLLINLPKPACQLPTLLRHPSESWDLFSVARQMKKWDASLAGMTMEAMSSPPFRHPRDPKGAAGQRGINIGLGDTAN